MIEKISTEDVVFIAKENKTRYAILGLLSHEPLTGYDIKKRIENSISYFWEASFGQIYPTLKQLAAEGLVEKEVQVSESGPNRKVYTITAAGKEALSGWLTTPVEPEILKYEVLLKLFFGNLVSPETSIQNITAFKNRTSANLLNLQHYETKLQQLPDKDHAHQYYLLTIILGKHLFEAQIRWANEAVAILNKLPNGGNPDEKTSTHS